MSEKYVAFLDILGFKEYVKTHKQRDVIKYISIFASVIYRQWKNHGLDRCDKNFLSTHVGKDIVGDNFPLEGLLVSDSLVLHTDSCSVECLKELVSYIKDVCVDCFKEKIILRCGLAKGNYDIENMVGAYKLEKKVFGGEAYVKAFQLEESSKTSAIIMDRKTRDDLVSANVYKKNEIFKEEGSGKECHYILPWMQESFFHCDNSVNSGNMRLYLSFAKESNWLPIYYNTLWYVVRKDENKLRKLFIDIIESFYENKDTKWNNIGLFIEHAKNSDVVEPIRYIINTLQLMGISGIKDRKAQIDGGTF